MIAPKLLLCFLAGALAVGAAADAAQPPPRLAFTPITLPAAPANLGDGEFPDAKPERFSGYFKLNRTYDAHMWVECVGRRGRARKVKSKGKGA